MPAFKLYPSRPGDKSFVIDGPTILLEVDYDDVDHGPVLREAKQVVRILNKHWKDTDNGRDDI